MKIKDIVNNSFAMPLTSPSYPRGPYSFINREYLIITYETEIARLKDVVPEPLEVTEPIVKFEFIRMPDSTGFGNYTESGQVIPVRLHGQPGSYSHAMYLDDLAPIVGGREIWGFPKKLAVPSLQVVNETLMGKLEYGGCKIAIGTMGYKYNALDCKKIAKEMTAANFLLKIIPHVDGSIRICELVQYNLTDVTVKGAWSGPAALELIHHVMAPVAALPIKRVLGAVHIVSDLILPYGKVVHDYLT